MLDWIKLAETQPVVSKVMVGSFKKDRMAHAYLFEGGKGTGKRATAHLVAKSFFCLEKKEFNPCGACRDCLRIDSGNHPDVHVIQPDGLSLKKEQILALQREFSKTGVESNRKVYTIEHADKMTVQAANSLLKFLEEPHSDTVAILLTNQVHHMLPTILSRCQVVSFKPLSNEHLIATLLDMGKPEQLVNLVAALTNDLEEAMGLFEEDWFAQARNIVIQLMGILDEKPKQVLIELPDKWLTHFKEREQNLIGLELILLWYKDLLYKKVGQIDRIVYTDQIEKLAKLSLLTTDQKIVWQITSVLESIKRLKANVNPHLLIEQLFMRLQEG